MKPVVVIGLGNPLMADEGVGPRVLEGLERQAADFPDVEFVDLGTGGLTVLHALAGRRKAVIVDCARMGCEPGEIRRCTPDEVRSRKELLRRSVHEADVLEIIDLSRRMGEAPGEIVLFGIEPAAIESGQELTPALRGRVAEYVAAVAAEIAGE